MDQKPKIHAKTAALLFGIDVNIIKKNEKGEWEPSVPKIGTSYYDLGKRARHAGNYDMTPFRLTQMTHLPLSESFRVLDVFHANNPEIRSVFHAGVINALRSNRTLISPNGRKRMFFSALNDKAFKEGFAQIPQSTVSDQTKFTMHRIKEELPPEDYYTKYRFLTEQHDGILAEVHKDYRDKYAETFKRIYERPINFSKCTLSRDFELIIPVELSWSDTNWQFMEDIKL
jgi:hypothetical protein